MRALADVARVVGLGDYLLLGRGEEATGGRDKASILADTLEAVIGTVYLSGGLPASEVVIHHLFDPLIEASVGRGAGLDWKTSLQELASSLGTSRTTGSASPAPTTPRSSRPPSASATSSSASARAGARRRPSSGPPNRRGARSTPAHRNPRADVPELPEVEVVRRGLAEHVAGRTVTGAEVFGARVTRRHLAGPQDLIDRLVGSGVASAARRGKYLWLVLDSPDGHPAALVIHLGMSGQLLVSDPGAPYEKHLHARLEFADGVASCGSSTSAPSVG